MTEGELKKYKVSAGHIKNALQGNIITSRHEYITIEILTAAKKDLLTNLAVRSDSEALCILTNKIKKWFGA